MCNFKSGIILKDKVFVPDYDQHTNMLKELGIEDNRQNAETKFIRAELIPPNNDMFTPIETWEFNVDQDILPDWYVKEVDRERMVEAVKEWAKEHIHIDESDFSIGKGTYYLKNCKRVTCSSSKVTAYGSSKVTAYGSSKVTACSSSEVTAYGSSKVTAYDSSEVTAYGSSTAFIPACSNAKRESIVLMENSTLKDCNTKTLYQSGDWKLMAINGGIIDENKTN